MNKNQTNTLLIAGAALAGLYLWKKNTGVAGVGGCKFSDKSINFLWDNAPESYRGIASDAWGVHEGKKTLMYMDSDGVTVLGLIEQMDQEIFDKYYQNAKKVEFFNRGLENFGK
jgi:hypothetical protein